MKALEKLEAWGRKGRTAEIRMGPFIFPGGHYTIVLRGEGREVAVDEFEVEVRYGDEIIEEATLEKVILAALEMWERGER